MQKKFEINWTKIKGGCQSGRKVVTHNCKSDFSLEERKIEYHKVFGNLNFCKVEIIFVGIVSLTRHTKELSRHTHKNHLNLPIICTLEPLLSIRPAGLINGVVF